MTAVAEPATGDCLAGEEAEHLSEGKDAGITGALKQMQCDLHSWQFSAGLDLRYSLQGSRELRGGCSKDPQCCSLPPCKLLMSSLSYHHGRAQMLQTIELFVHVGKRKYE